MPTASPVRLRALTSSRWKRLAIRLVAVAVVVVALLYAFLAFVSIRTNVLWFRSVHVDGVYGTILGAQILLFLVFGVLTAAAVAASALMVIRRRPRLRPDPMRQKWRYRYLRFESVLPHLAGDRRRALPRRPHRLPGDQPLADLRDVAARRSRGTRQDPQFHRDLSYYVAVLPFHRMVVTYLSSIVVLCLVVTLVTGYLYGALPASVPEGRDAG